MKNQYTVNSTSISKGLHGEIYLGFDTINQRKVAIKKFYDTNLGKHEALVMQSYGYSQLLPLYYNSFVIDNVAYNVMEFVEGEVLGTGYFDKKCSKKRNKRLAIQITMNVLKGLDHLHSYGILHNDIIPKNIMIENDQPKTVKIIDLGLSKISKNFTINNKAFQKDLNFCAFLCIYLIKGIYIDSNHDFELGDEMLSYVLRKQLNIAVEKRYHSAQEFYNALKPFI